MRFVWGLLFLAWGSSFIFDFDFNIGKYIFPAILIGIGINIIFGNNEKCRNYKYERRAEKFSKKAKKYEEKMQNEKGADNNE